MPRHTRLLLIALCQAFLLLEQGALAKSAYTFKKLVQSGNSAPSPHELGEILEASVDDRGRIVYGADGGLFYYPGHGPASLVGEYKTGAPGGGQFFQSWSSALNSTGDLFFRGEVMGPSLSGVYLRAAGKLSLLIPDGTLAPNGDALTPQYPVPNAAGDFAFIDGAHSNGLYLYAKGSISPIALPGGAAPGGDTFNLVSSYAINQSDQVAFIAYLASGGTGLYLASGGTITKIIATGDAFPDGSTFAGAGGVSMNDAGQIAFGGVNNNGSVQYEGLFLYSGGQSSVILPSFTTMPDGSYLEYVDETAINNAGQIALGCNTSGGLGTYLLSSGKLTQVAVTGQTSPDGDVFSNGGEYSVRINNSGQVLLLSGMVHHFAAVYLFSAGQLTRIAGEGDAVNHVPKFAYPTPVNIAAGDEVLVSDTTFPGGQGVFLASPGRMNQNTVFVANATSSISGASITYMPSYAMNNAGQVSIEALTSSHDADILLDSGNSLNLALSGASSGISPDGAMSINNLGEVGFFAYSSGGGSLYLYSSGLTNFLSGIPGYPFTLSVNSSDSAALLVMATPPAENGIYSFANGLMSPLAVTGTPAPGGGNFSFANLNLRFAPVMNDSGATAFAGSLDTANQSAIFLSANNTVSRIAGTGDVAPDGSVFTSVDSPSINSSGDIAFWAVTSSEVGIFVYSNGVITKVVASGDTIGTHTVGYIDHPQLGDTGHVAFLAMLSDGASAVFVAQPRPAGTTAAAISKEDLLLSSSTPLRPDSPLVIRLRDQYSRATEAGPPQSRNWISPTRK